MSDREVRWECMLPHAFRAAMRDMPVCFLPLGTVEWHGEHNALGLDSLKAHELCIRAAKLTVGGVVHPPLYGGMGGLDKPATVVVEGEHTWDNHLLRPWLEKLCSEFHRQGFRGIVMLTGHYGHNQQIVVRETAARMAERLQIPIIGTPEYWLAQDVGYLGDHAGVGETSLLWHLRPELVEIGRIDKDPDYGKDGYIKKNSNPELGKRYADTIARRLAVVAESMPGWSASMREASIRAERAIVSAQVSAWRLTGNPWAAWKRAFAGHADAIQYGPLIEKLDFLGIEAMASRLVSAD